MTATDELRRMLDERGVEWDGESYESVTFWNEETNLAVASDDRDGKLWMSLRVTPAQAIEATLGRGTCEVEIGTGQQRGWWVCQSCGDLFDSGSALACKKKQKPRYCPNCGRKVVDDASVD